MKDSGIYTENEMTLDIFKTWKYFLDTSWKYLPG